ncbi:MAG: hypothetical protein NTZ44_01900 [Candidatus Nomurabacteria bacterium]|nr:hypothetical protein [Candidatus Nomurabacteria bacterium]
MQSVKEFMEAPVSSFTGSEVTKKLMEEAIISRYGRAELKNLDCYHTMRTFHSWVKLGFKVRKGEKAFKSITYIEVKDSAGNVIRKIKRPCFLFYYKQIEPISKTV